MNVHTTKKRPIYQYIILYGFPLLIFQFFQYREIPVLILKMSGFIAPLLLFLTTFKLIWMTNYKRNSIPQIIKWILIISFISYIMAYIFWDQGILNSYRSSIWCLNLMYFFALLKYRYTEKELIHCVIFFSIINFLLWLYAMSQAPQVVFGRIGDSEELAQYVNNRGGYRINILGKNLVILLFFYYLVKLFREKKIYLYFLCFSIFIYICSDLTRSNIASIIITIFLFLILFIKLNHKYITFITTFIIISIFIIYSVLGEQIDILLKLTNSQFDGSMTGNDDGMWRINEYVFFLTEFNNNIFTYIFGNGFANSSPLQIELDRIKDIKMYFLSDVSYMQIFISMGLVGLFLYLKLFVKSLSLKTINNCTYVKLYLIYALIANLTIAPLLDSYTLSICLYLIYRSNINYKISKLIN